MVDRMWWRALGVAVVLLCVGVAGGYAVGDGTDETAQRTTVLEPMPAVSPSVPTPPVYDVFPDPTAAPLDPGVETETKELRITKRGAGVSVEVPVGWDMNRQDNSQVWTFTPDINTKNTYTLRVSLLIGQHLAVDVAKATRLTALRSAEANEDLLDLDVTTENSEGFEASYIDHGYLRVSLERFVGDENDTAFADVAVTGRTVDQEGMRDLLARVAESATVLDPLPPKGDDRG
jgi:hypothetical protein